MQYINVFANKLLEDFAATSTACASSVPASVNVCLHYVKDGNAAARHPRPTSPSDEKKTDHLDTSEFAPPPRHIGKVERWMGRGARAGYLAGCALTSTSDLFFGTPETTDRKCRPQKMRPTRNDTRVGLGIFRPKPTFETFEVTMGLLGSIYAQVASIVQWIGGNVGALIGAAGFAVMQGTQYVVRQMGYALFARYMDPDAPLTGAEFRAHLKRVAQRGDAVGVAVFGYPLYLAFGVSVGGAMLASAGIKCLSVAAGALIGTCAAAASNLLYGNKPVKQTSAHIWAAGRARVSELLESTIELCDSKAGLHRACMAAAKRDIDPSDVLEVLELRHGPAEL